MVAYKAMDDVSLTIDIDSLMANLDADGDGYIEYSGILDCYAEFIAGAIDRDKLLTVDRIKDCFSAFDKVGQRLFQGRKWVDLT